MNTKGKEKIERSDAKVVENIKYCPKCKEKRLYSSVERLQFEEGTYFMFCNRKGCTFIEEIEGKTLVSEEDLITFGLPGELLKHIDIFHEDVNKIVRLCMAEYLKMKLSSQLEYDFKSVQESVETLVQSHFPKDSNPSTEVLEAEASGPQATCKEDEINLVNPHCLNDSNQLTEVVEESKYQTIDKNKEVNLVQSIKSNARVGENPGDVSGFDFLSQYSQATRVGDHDFSAEEQVLKDLTGFPDFDGLGQEMSSASRRNQTLAESANDEFFTQFLQVLENESPQPGNPEDGETDFEKFHTKKLLSPKETDFQPQQMYNTHDLMKKLVDDLVEDLPIAYQENLKAAFSRIEGYNFPDDFINSISYEMPFLKDLREIERQERIQAEVDATLDNFRDEMDGFNLLL